MKILIIGANSCIADSILNNNDYKDDSFFLISRNVVSIKQKNIIETAQIDFNRNNAIGRLQLIINDFKPQVIIVAMVNYFDNDYVVGNKHLDNIYKINYKSIVDIIDICEDEKNVSTIVLFGSISSIIGKKFNVHYASLKRALDSYIESLLITKINLNVQYYKLGYLDSNANTNLRFFKTNLKRLSSCIRDNILLKKDLNIYYPYYWKYLAVLIKNVPRKILSRLI